MKNDKSESFVWNFLLTSLFMIVALTWYQASRSITGNISIEEASKMSGLNESELNDVSRGGIFDSNFLPNRTMLSLEGVIYGERVTGWGPPIGYSLIGHNNTRCPGSLSFERSDNGFSYSISKQDAKEYEKQTVESCVGEVLAALPGLHAAMVNAKEKAKDKEAKEAAERKRISESWEQ